MRRSSAGFTLLEVMVALAILAMSLTVLTQAQQASMRQVLRSKMMTIAALLAREKMVDVEDELFKDGFSDFEEEEKGDFRDEGFKRFSWKMKVEKLELPKDINTEAIGDAAGDAKGSGGASGGGGGAGGMSGMAALGGQMLGKQFEMFRNVLEQAIRRVSLEVSWKEGRRAKKITVVSYFTDPRKVDAAGGIGALGGTATPKTGTTGGTTSGARLPGTTPARTPTPAVRR